MNPARFAPSACAAQHLSGASGGIVSSFRFICIAALTGVTAVFVADVAAAPSPVGSNQSAKHYLAGLPPPHEHHKAAPTKTAHADTQHQPATKIAQPATKRRPPVTANAKRHRATRLADKINSQVAWPSVEPAAAVEQTTPATVLEFATEDAAQAPVAPPHPASPAPPAVAAKISPPAKIVAADEPNTIDSASAAQPATASTPVQTEPFEPPASRQMRVILPAQSEAPVTASIPNDQRPAHRSSIAAQLLATLAGAIAAGLVGWLMIGFGSVRTIKSRRT
jgi:hypothetical protein